MDVLTEFSNITLIGLAGIAIIFFAVLRIAILELRVDKLKRNTETKSFKKHADQALAITRP